MKYKFPLFFIFHVGSARLLVVRDAWHFLVQWAMPGWAYARVLDLRIFLVVFRFFRFCPFFGLARNLRIWETARKKKVEQPIKLIKIAEFPHWYIQEQALFWLSCPYYSSINSDSYSIRMWGLPSSSSVAVGWAFTAPFRRVQRFVHWASTGATATSDTGQE